MSPKDILKIIESIELFIQKIEDTQAEVASTSSGTNSDTPSSEELTEPSVYNRTFLDVVKDNIPTEEERRGAEKEVAEEKAVAAEKAKKLDKLLDHVLNPPPPLSPYIRKIKLAFPIIAPLIAMIVSHTEHPLKTAPIPLFPILLIVFFFANLESDFKKNETLEKESNRQEYI